VHAVTAQLDDPVAGPAVAGDQRVEMPLELVGERFVEVYV
jgi:hypothetical protein